MRLALVRGHLTLNLAVETLRGCTLVIVEPVKMENLRAGNGRAGGKSLIAVDSLGASEGQLVAITEGREAANPFWPAAAPVDAWCSVIIDRIEVQPNDVAADQKRS